MISPEEFFETKERVIAEFERWRHVLGLTSWDFTHEWSWSEEKDSRHGAIQAACNP